MKPLLSQNVTIEEEQEEVKKNGHSGDREEMGPSMPKQKVGYLTFYKAYR